jgi:hypothetical protein
MPSRMKVDVSLLSLALTVPAYLFCCGCVVQGIVGQHHTPDAQLEQQFFRHEGAFESLLQVVMVDSNLTTIKPSTLIYGGQQADVQKNDLSEAVSVGMSKERWAFYQSQITALGIAGGILKGGGAIEFRVDQGSTSNGDSYKGYEYCERIPGRLLSSLDSYGIQAPDSQQDRDAYGNWRVYKRLKGNWYLYLFVNR